MEPMDGNWSPQLLLASQDSYNVIAIVLCHGYIKCVNGMLYTKMNI